MGGSTSKSSSSYGSSRPLASELEDLERMLDRGLLPTTLPNVGTNKNLRRVLEELSRSAVVKGVPVGELLVDSGAVQATLDMAADSARRLDQSIVHAVWRRKLSAADTRPTRRITAIAYQILKYMDENRGRQLRTYMATQLKTKISFTPDEYTRCLDAFASLTAIECETLDRDDVFEARLTTGPTFRHWVNTLSRVFGKDKGYFHGEFPAAHGPSFEDMLGSLGVTVDAADDDD